MLDDKSQGIVRDNRGEEQPADKDRAQKVNSVEEKKSTHPANTPGRRDLPVRISQAATAALCWCAFQFHGSRSATLLAG